MLIGKVFTDFFFFLFLMAVEVGGFYFPYTLFILSAENIWKENILCKENKGTLQARKE